MKNIKFIERLLLPDYKNVKEITWGTIKVDRDKCTGCSLCIKACPADSILMENKKAHIKPPEGDIISETGVSQCMACGDCTALCPAGAITLISSYRWTKFFRTIDRGELSLPRL